MRKSEPPLPLTPAVFHILLALFGKERHGYDIMQQVKADSGDAVKMGPGTLYGSLDRMIEAGLVAKGTTQDPRRIYYRLTALGQTTLRAELSGCRAWPASRAASSGPHDAMTSPARLKQSSCLRTTSLAAYSAAPRIATIASLTSTTTTARSPAAVHCLSVSNHTAQTVNLGYRVLQGRPPRLSLHKWAAPGIVLGRGRLSDDAAKTISLFS
jgi:DNA-binding PadR family transcriptional regulator